MNTTTVAILEAYQRLRTETTIRPLPPDVLRNSADEGAAHELMKFLAIRAVVDGAREGDFKVGMRTSAVDDLWHRWLLWTGHYAGTCMRAFGHMVHHATNSPEMSPGEWISRHKLFHQVYKDTFGEVPPVAYWGTWGDIEREFLARTRAGRP